MSVETIKGVASLLVIGTLVIGVYSNWPTPEQQAKTQQESAIRAQEYKAQQAELQAQKAAADLATDTAAAARMDTTLAHYRWGADRASAAHVACQSAVSDTARYGYRSDWLPNYSWSVNPVLATWSGKSDESLYIVGVDLQFKNAFNAQEYMRYACIVTTDHKVPSESLTPSAWTARIVDISPLKGGR